MSNFIYRLSRRIHDSVFALQVFNVMRFSAFFLVSVLLVKIPLNLEQIASYEYVLFLSSIVTGWWIHGFIQSFMADIGDAMEPDGKSSSGTFRDYSRVLLVLGSAIFLVFAVAIKGLSTWGILESPPAGFYFFLVFHFILQAGVLVIYYLHQKQMAQYIYLYAAYFFFTYLGSFLFLTGGSHLLQNTYRWLVVFSVPVGAVWLYLYIRSKPPNNATEVVGQSFPHLHILLLIQAIGFVSLWSDGFWVQYFYGTDELFALFRYGGREFPLFVILTTTFATAMIHQARDKKGLTRIHRGSVRFIRLFCPLIILLLLSSQWLFSWVYSEDFVPASIIFDLYLLLTLVRVIFPRPILIAAGKFQALVWISVGELLINLILSLTFYYILGILGLILATLIAHFFELGASLYFVHQKLHIKMEQYLPVRSYLIFALVIILIVVIKYMWFGPDWMEIMMNDEL